jgi:hypothetical protein
LENYFIEFYDRANRPGNLEVETEEEVPGVEKDPCMIYSEAQKYIKDMKNKKMMVHLQVYSNSWEKLISK